LVADEVAASAQAAATAAVGGGPACWALDGGAVRRVLEGVQAEAADDSAGEGLALAAGVEKAR